MKISYFIYELIARSPLNSKMTHSTRQGALLKFEFKGGSIGYADCHPWVELGDSPLTEQLRHLTNAESSTPLMQRSLHFARLDAKARAQGVNLFEGLSIPESHFLIPNLLQWETDQILTALKQGFTHFKVKLGADLAQELIQLKSLFALFSSKIKVRLDFNLKLTLQQFEEVLTQLAPYRGFIDFYEDPCSYDTTAWSKWQKGGLCLACDYQSQQAIGYPQCAEVLVIKPAVQDESIYLTHSDPKQRLVFTTYLDHPLGQLATAYTAAVAFKKKPVSAVCGLLSHTAYQRNEFSEQLSQNGPAFVLPKGTGFGFDDLLKKQKWVTL